MFRKLHTLITQPLFIKRADSETPSSERGQMEKVQIKTAHNVQSVIAGGGVRGFTEDYRAFIESPKFTENLSKIQNDRENFSERMDFHATHISDHFFTMLFSDPTEIKAALYFFLELITGSNRANIQSEKSGVKIRTERFDVFYFSLLSRYQSLKQEDQKKAMGVLVKTYGNIDGESSVISGNNPAKGFIGTLIYSISELENNPRPEFVRLGLEGDIFSGFGLRITAKNAAILFSGKNIMKSQLWFSRIEGDIGMSNLHFHHKAGQFGHFRNTLNAKEEMNWYSRNKERLSVTFHDNSGAYAWIENSCAYGRVLKRPTTSYSYHHPDDMDAFMPGALKKSTPGALGCSTIEKNSFFRGEFTIGGRYSHWNDSGLSLIVGSAHSTQKDDAVLYGTQSKNSFNGAFVFRGLEKASFDEGFGRAFVLSGLQNAHFKDAGYASVFIADAHRKIGENATWEGQSLAEGLFFGPHCFSHTLTVDRQQRVYLNQQDSLHKAMCINNALSKRRFYGNTLRKAEFIGGASSSIFLDGAANKSVVYPNSLNNTTIMEGTFFFSKILGGMNDSHIYGGLQSSMLCSDINVLQRFVSKAKEEIGRRTNIAYANDYHQGNNTHSYNETCEDIAVQEIGKVKDWIDLFFQASFKKTDLRIPFARSVIDEKNTSFILANAFISEDVFSPLSKKFPEFEKLRSSKVGTYSIVSNEDIIKLIIGEN
ncbi:MAG: hypothetical protein PHN60_03685 [Candidatus Gracilibacteria bacterium]|nr:hypothetical protein [Candidatus Gracilibacteria bacterium]